MVVASGNGVTVSPAVMFLSQSNPQSNPIASSCAIRSAVNFLLDLSGVLRAARALRQKLYRLIFSLNFTLK